MLEAKPRVTSGEFMDQKPFVIRAHHLPNYTSVVMGDNPSTLAKRSRLRIEDDRRKSLLTIDGINSKPAKYGWDVLGTADQADNFEENTRLAFETFLHLPNSYPAAIVEGIPDVLCNGCAIGEHCRRLFNNDYHEGGSTLRADMSWTDLFLERLNELNLPKPIIIQEQTSFSDTGYQKVRRVITTIGTIKEVLQKSET